MPIFEHKNHQHTSVAYDLNYHQGRKHSSRQLKYRLERRTSEVQEAIINCSIRNPQLIVDIGTADGLMADKLQAKFKNSKFIGIDLSSELLKSNKNMYLNKIQADAESIPLTDNIADVIIATAIIEHVPNPKLFIRECKRILKPTGIIVISTPDPFLEFISSKIGLLKETGHQYTFTLSQLNQLIQKNGFTIIKERKFMFSPVGFPGEKWIEHLLRFAHLNAIMANQLIVASRNE